jgi:hypothetical protein
MFCFCWKNKLVDMKQYEKEKKNKFIQPRPEVLLLLLNIQLTTAKGHHLVLYNFFCLNFPRNQRVNLYQYWGESFLDRCLSKLYPTILPIIQHHGHCYLQIAYRAKKATKWAEIWTVVKYFKVGQFCWNIYWQTKKNCNTYI